MKITAITKFKHGALYAILRKLNWHQATLAQKCGVSLGTINRIVNLKSRPTAELARKMYEVFLEQGEYLDIVGEWPENFEGFSQSVTVEETRDVVDLTMLNETRTPLLIESDGLDKVILNELENTLTNLLKTITPKQRQIIRLRYLKDLEPREIAAKLNCHVQNVVSLEAAALRKLRHPTRIKHLASYLEK